MTEDSDREETQTGGEACQPLSVETREIAHRQNGVRIAPRSSDSESGWKENEAWTKVRVATTALARSQDRGGSIRLPALLSASIAQECRVCNLFGIHANTETVNSSTTAIGRGIRKAPGGGLVREVAPVGGLELKQSRLSPSYWRRLLC